MDVSICITCASLVGAIVGVAITVFLIVGEIEHAKWIRTSAIERILQ